MCDPVTIGAVALSAAGAGVNAYETNQNQSRMIDARNNATQAELGRQKGFQAKSNEIFGKSVDGFAPTTQAANLADNQQTVASSFQGNAPTAQTVGSITSGTAPAVVGAAETKKIGDILGLGTASNTARGNLAGYSQNQFNNKINLNDTNRNLDLNTDLSKTSAGVGKLEQDANYKNAFRPNSGVGDILQLGGQLGAYGAGRGWFNPAAPAVAGAPLNILPPGGNPGVVPPSPPLPSAFNPYNVARIYG